MVLNVLETEEQKHQLPKNPLSGSFIQDLGEFYEGMLHHKSY